MSNLSGFVKRLRDIMRNDAGINGDAQRIEQIAWMLFLKVYDSKEQDWEWDDDGYVSIIPDECRWANWAHDDKSGSAMTGDKLLNFVNNTLFPTLKHLPVDATTPIKKAIVQTTFADANNYMKDGTSGGIVNAENCVNRGKIVIKNTGKDDASIGGICGTFRRGYIKNCVNLGKLVIEYTGTKTTHIGGIVGFVNTPEGEGAYIENVISCANISSVTNAGGIIGYIHTSFVDFKIKNAYSLTQNLEANNRGAVIGGSKKTSNTCTVENVTAITIEGVTPVGTGVEIEIATMNPIVSIDELFADLDYSSILAAVGLDSLSLPKPPAEETEPTVPGKPEPEATETTVTDPEVSEPEETKPEETKPEETKPEETKPEDTKPEGTEPTQTPSTDAPGTEKPAEGGCGSVVAGGLAILAVVALAGVALKKRD